MENVYSQFWNVLFGDRWHWQQLTANPGHNTQMLVSTWEWDYGPNFIVEVSSVISL